MGYEYIETSREDALAVITMARPEKRNALSEAHLRELLEAFEGAGRSDARGVILAARGPVFSAGHDFSDMDGRDIEAMRQLLDVCAQVMSTIQSTPRRRRPGVSSTGSFPTSPSPKRPAPCYAGRPAGAPPRRPSESGRSTTRST